MSCGEPEGKDGVIKHTQIIEPPYTDPYVRWCERSGASLPPTRFHECMIASTLPFHKNAQCSVMSKHVEQND